MITRESFGKLGIALAHGNTHALTQLDRLTDFLEAFLGEDGLPLCVRVTDPLGGAFFATTQAAALNSRPDWIQIATWNDWNELTQVEPAWHPDLLEELAAGALSPEVLHHSFGRALEAQAMVAAFRGEELAPEDVVNAAAEYLEEVRSDPAVPAYD